MKKLCFAVLLFVWNPVHAHASLVTNGSFEASTVGPRQNVPLGATDITGWVVTRDAIDYLDSSSLNPLLVWQAADGTRSLDLNGSPGMGGIEQTIATQAGGRYLVTFGMSGNPTGGPTVKQMRVAAASQSADFFFDITGHNTQNMGWTPESWMFTANAPMTPVEFS